MGKDRCIKHDLNHYVVKLAGEHLDNPPIGCTLKKCPEAPPGY